MEASARVSGLHCLRVKRREVLFEPPFIDIFGLEDERMHMVQFTVRQFDTRMLVPVLVAVGVLLISSPSGASLLDYFLWPQEGQYDSKGRVSTNLISEHTEIASDFIVPNEFDNYLHYNELSRVKDGVERAVVSVGTLRAFNLAGYMERDYLICLDYAPGVIQFNKALANLIAKHDRLDLLRLLLLDTETLQVKPDESEYRALRRRLAMREDAGELARAYELSGSTSDPDLKVIYGFLASGKSDRPNWRSWLKAFSQFTMNRERYEALFLGNERSYRHLQKMIREGKFFAITGSLSGEKAIRSISGFLRERGLVISEFDPSNALEHVVRAEKEKGMAAFIRNVEQLPFAIGGRILVTVDTRFMSLQDHASFPSIGTWHYAVYKPESLATHLKDARDDQTLVQAFARAGALRSGRPSSCHSVFEPRSSIPLK